MEGTYGALSLIPVIVVIVTAIITKRAVEPLILGTLVGYVIIAKENFVLAYLDSLYVELGESAYYVVIFRLLTKSKGKFLFDFSQISNFDKLSL